MIQSRRSLLAAIGLSLPVGLGGRAKAAGNPNGPIPSLRFLPFEEAVRQAFADAERSASGDVAERSHRIEVGHSELIQAGLQGCHNDRPFAGFPEGHLKIVRAGFEPGPKRGGVRLYLATVDLVATDGRSFDGPSRPLDFASLPPAPTLA